MQSQEGALAHRAEKWVRFSARCAAQGPKHRIGPKVDSTFGSDAIGRVLLAVPRMVCSRAFASAAAFVGSTVQSCLVASPAGCRRHVATRLEAARPCGQLAAAFTSKNRSVSTQVIRRDQSNPDPQNRTGVGRGERRDRAVHEHSLFGRAPIRCVLGKRSGQTRTRRQRIRRSRWHVPSSLEFRAD
jgi:hypothetical protein